MDDDAVAQVVMVTNTTTEKAIQYLTLADGRPDQAITLFFENGGADLVSSPSPSHPSSTHPAALTHSDRRGDAQNPIDLDDDDAFNDDHPQVTSSRRVAYSANQGSTPSQAESTFEDDAAMARRLQEEMYEGSGRGGMGGEDTIRAPIARQSETLLGPGASSGGYSDADIPAAIEEGMRDLQRRRMPAARPGIFNQVLGGTSSVWNGDDDDNVRSALAQATGGASEASSKSNMLAKLFQPPWNLMYKGTWESAREEGREDKKWLLVNIQNGSVFACQVLNRDLWKNPSVAETVQENFLFLQYSHEDIRAEQYLQYYFQHSENPDLYPHIAIVDPRTGEQVKVWSRETPNPQDFLMQLHEFLDRYSLNNNVRNPVARRKPEPKKEKEVHAMTEEEMMEAALQASLATQQDEQHLSKPIDPDELTRSIGDLPGDGNIRTTGRVRYDEPMDASEDTLPTASTAVTSPFASIPSNRPHVEPVVGPNVTRIQFRHPAGRVIRRFELSDPVSRIFEWLKAEPLEGKAGSNFELVSMGKNLLNSAGTTIEQAGLKNGTVMIEFVED